MKNFLYILVILYNLNLLLNTYIEIMIKIITLFNYKNTTNFTENSFIGDITSYWLHRNFIYTKIYLNYARENSLMVKLQSSKLSL